MTSERTPKRFSLLVGVDTYLEGTADKERTLEKGKRVSLRNLHGAANDVQTISKLLQDQFYFEKPTTLVSSASSNDSRTPKEPEKDWPTHENIKREFDAIRKAAKEHDVFLFYFAGHGARLKAIPGHSPGGVDSKDPSLMTTDFCRRGPAIRGWELNSWLEQLNKNGVRVIVILDSCYSGGSWRDDANWRTPKDWKSPPNLPSDETVVQGTKGKPGHRDGEMEVSWTINPQHFTVMTACTKGQKAAEKTIEGLAYGAFTSALKECLTEDPESISTYRFVKERTASTLGSWDLEQKPQVFGDDRLAFLEDYEPVTATPVLGLAAEDTVTLSMGKIHRVHVKTLYVDVSKSIEVEITEVRDTESEGNVVRGGPIKNPPQTLKLLPYRWAHAEALKVTVDQSLGQEFRQRLENELGKRLVGQFLCILGPQEASEEETGVVDLHLQKDGTSINIRGKVRLHREEEKVFDWKVKGQNGKEKATESAIALRHLFRFGQILQLRNNSEDSAPFLVTITQPDKNDASIHRHTFKNTGDEELYFFVFILSSGFHVKQLKPQNDEAKTLDGGKTDGFRFRLTPPRVPEEGEISKKKKSHRDIVRTIVMRGKSVSMKSIELPDIWHAGDWEKQCMKKPMTQDRNGDPLEEFLWWVDDKPIDFEA